LSWIWWGRHSCLPRLDVISKPFGRMSASARGRQECLPLLENSRNFLRGAGDSLARGASLGWDVESITRLEAGAIRRAGVELDRILRGAVARGAGEIVRLHLMDRDDLPVGADE